MKFAKWVFLIAGVIGIIEVAPLYFLENQIGRDFPPPITHPEFFYGFIGVVLAWQVLFLILSSDPIRYRPMMLPAVLEKASYAIAGAWLFFAQRIPALTFGFAMMDLVFGLLFLMAYWRTGREMA